MDRPGRSFCSDCIDQIDFIKPESYLYEVKGTAAAFWLDGFMQKAVYDYKFAQSVHLTVDFVDCLEAAVKANFHLDSFEAIVPIPLTLPHRFLRGYNQTEYLAKALAKRLEKRYLPRALKRIGSPVRQSSLKEEDREENVKGTFKAGAKALIEGKKLLVLDDIMTTGATLKEAMKTLKESGAASVLGLSLAKTRLF